MKQLYLAAFIGLLFSGGFAHALTLQDAIGSAEKIDPQVQSALASSEAALAGIQIARSRLLPVIQGVGSYGRTNQTANRVDPILGSFTQQFINSTPNSQVFLRQALFNMASWAGLSVSELQNEFGLIRLAAAYGDLWLRVSNSWLDLVAAQETLDIQTKAERFMTQVALQAQKSYEAGVTTKDTALEAKAQLAFVRSNAIEARLILAARQRGFLALTGMEPLRVQQAHMNFSKKYKTLIGTEQAFQQKVNEFSPEIAAAKMTEEIKRMQLKQVRAGSTPTVDFFTSYQQTQNSNINQINLGVISTQASVQVTIPFYSGGLYVGQERQAAAFVDLASADVRASELRITTAVHSFWATQQAQIDRVVALEEMVVAGQEVVNAYQMGVKAGLRSWSDVANAEVVLTRRRVDQVNAIASMLKAQAQLLAFLPVTDESWSSWLNGLAFEVKRAN
jgi:outer membrane protein TolC